MAKQSRKFRERAAKLLADAEGDRQRTRDWEGAQTGDEPRCPSCGVAWKDHLGMAGTCAKLVAMQQKLDALLEAARPFSEKASAARVAERCDNDPVNYWMTCGDFRRLAEAVTKARSEFEADTEQEVKIAVEQWAQKQFERIAAACRLALMQGDSHAD